MSIVPEASFRQGLALTVLVCVAGILAPICTWAQDATGADPTVFGSLLEPDSGSASELFQAQFTQPTVPQSPPPPQQQSQRRRTPTRGPFPRLARVPNMFGDTITPLGQLVAAPLNGPAASFDLPLAAASRRSKFTENNKGLPMDRVFFIYNYFDDALFVDPDIAVPGRRKFNVNRYTLGLEKTLFVDWASIDVRLPLANRFNYSQNVFNVDGGELGNLSVLLKVLLFHTDDETFAVAGGLGIDTPTGDDVDAGVNLTRVTVENESVHLLPYLAFILRPDDDWFFQGSMQFDFAANGNPIIVRTPTTFFAPSITRQVGKMTDQSLMYIDLSLGRWLYQNLDSDGLSGIAAVVELHHTTSFQPSDTVAFNSFGNQFAIRQTGNWLDFLNFTAGLQANWGELTTIRVGGVFPLRNDFDRPFNAELQFSINRYF